jgi:RNA polymerase sigma factor (sigma-70 family)
VREPEPETIARARGGDLSAFESLVREYQADVWRFAYQLTRNRATAEDVTQEAFIHAYRAIDSYRGQAKFTSWLLRIARNCAIDSYRKSHREQPTSGEELGRERDETLAPVSVASEDRLRIEAAVRRLPRELREPFVVIEVLGFNYLEASAILAVKVGTIKSRMHRARAALVRELTDEEIADEV